MIIGAWRAGWTAEQITAFSEEAASGDYDKVVQTAMKYLDVNVG